MHIKSQSVFLLSFVTLLIYSSHPRYLGILIKGCFTIRFKFQMDAPALVTFQMNAKTACYSTTNSPTAQVAVSVVWIYKNI